MRHLIAAGALVAALATPLAAEGSGSIAVTIKMWEEQQPIAGATVTLIGGGLSAPRVQTTNAQGQTCFIGVPPGEGYSISVEAPGVPLGVGKIGRIFASFRRDVVGYRSRTDFVCGELMSWSDRSIPPLGSFVVPIPKHPPNVICL